MALLSFHTGKCYSKNSLKKLVQIKSKVVDAEHAHFLIYCTGPMVTGSHLSKDQEFSLLGKKNESLLL